MQILYTHICALTAVTYTHVYTCTLVLPEAFHYATVRVWFYLCSRNQSDALKLKLCKYIDSVAVQGGIAIQEYNRRNLIRICCTHGVDSEQGIAKSMQISTGRLFLL